MDTVSHLILYVADQARSTAFYRHALGATPRLDVPGMSEFDLSSGCVLGLMPIAGARELLGAALPDPARAAGVPRAELYLLVADPAASHQRALAAGARELSPLLPRDWGHLAAYALDPDGHVLAFASAVSQGNASPGSHGKEASGALPSAALARPTAKTNTQASAAAKAELSRHLIGLERAALDRWCKGDPSGFLEISAPDVVYFDPFLEQRIDGLPALCAYYETIRGKVSAQHFELVNPCVQLVGSAAILTFNFVSYGGSDDAFRWNCTEVFRCEQDSWKLVQTHWSFTKPRPA